MTTINVTGNHTNDPKINGADALSNVSTINVWGTTEMSLLYPNAFATVNLEPLSRWIGGYNIDNPYGNFRVQGAWGATFQNTHSFNMGTVTIDANVTGSGTFMEDAAHGHGKLEFMHSVSAGQTVTTESYGFCNGVTQVDDPYHYHASNVLGFGEIILEGLKQITSYSLQNDLLLLYRGNTAVYGTHLSLLSLTAHPSPGDAGLGAASNFGVTQTASALDIHADNQYHQAGVTLGIHS